MDIWDTNPSLLTATRAQACTWRLPIGNSPSPFSSRTDPTRDLQNSTDNYTVNKTGQKIVSDREVNGGIASVTSVPHAQSTVQNLTGARTLHLPELGTSILHTRCTQNTQVRVMFLLSLLHDAASISSSIPALRRIGAVTQIPLPVSRPNYLLPQGQPKWPYIPPISLKIKPKIGSEISQIYSTLGSHPSYGPVVCRTARVITIDENANCQLQYRYRTVLYRYRTVPYQYRVSYRTGTVQIRTTAHPVPYTTVRTVRYGRNYGRKYRTVFYRTVRNLLYCTKHNSEAYLNPTPVYLNNRRSFPRTSRVPLARDPGQHSTGIPVLAPTCGGPGSRARGTREVRGNHRKAPPPPRGGRRKLL